MKVQIFTPSGCIAFSCDGESYQMTEGYEVEVIDALRISLRLAQGEPVWSDEPDPVMGRELREAMEGNR
jgi:hypothetical protein